MDRSRRALVVAALASIPAEAQGVAKSPAAEPVRNGSVQEVLDLAKQNQPSAINPPKPTSTLDDYAQGRRKIKLEIIVPYLLLATPLGFSARSPATLSGARGRNPPSTETGVKKEPASADRPENVESVVERRAP